MDPENDWKPGEQYAARKRPGIGHYGGPPIGPPHIPRERPPRGPKTTAALLAIADYFAQFADRTQVPVVWKIIQFHAGWTRAYFDEIMAASDPPLTYDELQAKQGQPGRDDHHKVTKAEAYAAGFSKERIESPRNRVTVPRLRHYSITGWFARQNKDFGGLSPTQYLRDKSWEEREDIGEKALRDAGVLK